MPGDVQIVILAGGQGTRFWPVSRKKMPKQFLSITKEGKSLIQITAERVKPFCKDRPLMVISNKDHADLVMKHLPEAELYTEPEARNTAPAVGLAACIAAARNPETVLVILPADHVVTDVQEFQKILTTGIDRAARGEDLVTIGITPEFANTGYGYIQCGESEGDLIRSVAAFHEKPERRKAEGYISSGNYFWNSGMFIWRADKILEEIKLHLPELYSGLAPIQSACGTPDEKKVINEVFPSLPKVSIDVGVMEKSRSCVMVEAAEIGWSDVGSWDAWASHMPQDIMDNVIQGKQPVMISSHHNVVVAPDRTVALVGVENLIIIDTGDALLVCSREEAQRVKDVVEKLKEAGKEELL